MIGGEASRAASETGFPIFNPGGPGRGSKWIGGPKGWQGWGGGVIVAEASELKEETEA